MEEYLQFAGRLADAAREISLRWFRAGVAVQNKNDDSPVTNADRECEQKMRELIAGAYPQHSVVGEEFGGDAHDGWVWILDPIDGTRSFISGSPQFCSLIGLSKDGAPALGVIDMPALDERWVGYDFNGLTRAAFNNEACSVASLAVAGLSEAVMATTTLAVAEDWRDDALRRLCKCAGHVRLGGDAQAFGSLASGFLHLACDYEMAPHDYMPLVPIIRAAGGVITDWQGNSPMLGRDKIGVIAAADSSLHSAAVQTLRQA